MQWIDIKNQYPNQFILIGNLIEEKISTSKTKIVAGDVLQVSNDPKVIRDHYQMSKNSGQNVLFTLPSTPTELIVENIPFKGIFR